MRYLKKQLFRSNISPFHWKDSEDSDWLTHLMSIQSKMYMLLISILFFPKISDVFWFILCRSQSLRQIAYLYRKDHWIVQRQKTPWSASTCICHHRYSLQVCICCPYLYKINTIPHGSLCIMMHNVYKKFNVARLYLTVSIVALNTNLKFEICSTYYI